MSARADVLTAVRAALATTEASATATRPRPSEAVTRPVADRASVLDLFAERVADYKADVTRCSASDLESVVATALGGKAAVVPSGLDLPVPNAMADDGLTSAELDAVEAVVTGAAVGIAETGTVVLDHGATQGRRAITLLPDLHVCIVRESQIVPDVADALTLLDPLRPQTWVSGPSATSDIELSRVEGVHGPRTLHVVLVAD